MRTWKAVRPSMHGGYMPLITVGAYDLDEARNRIREQLARPGRTFALLSWQDDGECVQDDTGTVHTL